MRLAGWAFSGRRRFALAQRLARIAQPFALRVGPLAGWGRTRDLKPIPGETFRKWWRSR
jgi:hypothetical protein